MLRRPKPAVLESTGIGFTGNGTVYSMIAAQIVPTLLKGRPDADADLYRSRQ